MTRLKIAIIQFDSSSILKENLNKLEEIFARYITHDIQLVLLPENFAIRANEEIYKNEVETINKTAFSWASKIASRYKIWLVAGSLPEMEKEKLYNTAMVFTPEGNCYIKYRKIHLFEISDDSLSISENRIYVPGVHPALFNIKGWRFGLSICYDLRFPELYRHYSKCGCQVICVLSNFTYKTGKKHWEILLRARAIENQCYVLAANQCGINRISNVASYGHSMVVAPDGEIILEAGETEDILTAELIPGKITEYRTLMPVLKHRIIF